METERQNRTAGRMDRLIHERVHDPYKTKSKPPEPTVCPVCYAVFKEGRWQWADSWPIDAHRQTCQACHRTQDGFPAGVVTVSGAFALSHRAEVLNLAQHHEQQEKREHPLHRIMQIEEKPDSIVIKTPRSECRLRSFRQTSTYRIPLAKHCIMPTKAAWSFDTQKKAILSR